MGVPTSLLSGISDDSFGLLITETLSKEGVRQPAFSVVSKDTTGAGDVYHGGYIYGLLKGWNMPACMAFASSAAALTCRNGGGWRGIPELHAVQDLMKFSTIS
ncbi:carbohydrate kinase, PfkB family [delta proteobacterium NaphS2]|nr:carbohydrate kinase, PfkB family [delta proteobacterium NaphS2]